MDGEKLTPKQAAFCREYLVDLNATQAAIRAGFSAKTAEQIGFQLLKKTSVSKTIQIAMDERARRTQIDADYVLMGIKELTERCIQANPVIVDGQPTGEYKFEANAALKGYELLGKHLKLFTDKVDHQNLDKNGQPADAITKIVIEHVSATKE